MAEFFPSIDELSSTPKFIQVVESFEDAIKSEQLQVGDVLPSVNVLCAKLKLSRDTVFKALTELKQRSLIESVPNKGYFVASNSTRVFLLIDTLKTYKELMYDTFRKSLPPNITVDVHFHHFNIRVFEELLRSSIGKYSKYVIMSFDNPKMKELIPLVDADRLLMIDWNIYAKPNIPFIGQDFGQTLYDALVEALPQIRKYNQFNYVYPEFTFHPKESINYFKKFCTDYQINHQVIMSFDEMNPQKGEVYMLVSDRTLYRLLDASEEKNLELGKDLGIISYNETPLKKYVKNGITVISADFKEMGVQAAQFVLTGEPRQRIMPTQLILRGSL